MNTLYRQIILTAMVIGSSLGINAQTVWDGPTMTFVKESNSDWTLEENQDRITDSVWITRQNNRGLFNIFVEDSDADGDACDGPEPSGTEWAYGTTSQFASLTFVPLGELNNCEFTSIVDGQDIVLHLIDEDIYIDFKFISYQAGGGTGSGGGGGFSYERSTENFTHTNELENKPLMIYPNPAREVITISGQKEGSEYQIYNLIGAEVQSGIIGKHKSIKINELETGLYFIALDQGETIRFLKE